MRYNLNVGYWWRVCGCMVVVCLMMLYLMDMIINFVFEMIVTVNVCYD
jgi:hypothetical protein